MIFGHGDNGKDCNAGKFDEYVSYHYIFDIGLESLMSFISLSLYCVMAPMIKSGTR